MKVKQNKMVLALAGMMMVVMMGGCEKSEGDTKSSTNAPEISAEPLSPEAEKAVVAEQVAYFAANIEEAKQVHANCEEEAAVLLRNMNKASSAQAAKEAALAYSKWLASQPAARNIRCHAAWEALSNAALGIVQ